MNNNRDIKIFENGKLKEVLHRPAISDFRNVKPTRLARTRIKRNRLGSNQYETKREEHWKKTLFVGTVFILLIAFIFHTANNYFNPKMISPIPDGKAYAQEPNAGESAKVKVIELPTATPIVKPTATPTPEPKAADYDKIDAEIKRVFGKHYKKAMLLLKGNGPGTCHENAGLRPDAENRNLNADGTVSSIDYGVFQINAYWQGFRHTGKAEQFLLDPSINIRVAWSIYEADGYSFKQWTCGRYYGI